MTAKPSAKTGFTGLAGVASGAGLAPLIVWIAAQLGIEMPTEVAVIVGGLIAAAASLAVAWLVPAKSGTYVENPDQDWPAGESMADYATEDEEV